MRVRAGGVSAVVVVFLPTIRLRCNHESVPKQPAVCAARGSRQDDRCGSWCFPWVQKRIESALIGHGAGHATMRTSRGLNLGSCQTASFSRTLDRWSGGGGAECSCAAGGAEPANGRPAKMGALKHVTPFLGMAQASAMPPQSLWRADITPRKRTWVSPKSRVGGFGSDRHGCPRHPGRRPG